MSLLLWEVYILGLEGSLILGIPLGWVSGPPSVIIRLPGHIFIVLTFKLNLFKCLSFLLDYELFESKTYISLILEFPAFGVQ